MGQFLNNKEPYDKFKTVMNGTYFVDKSEILEELIPALQQEQRFFCITRPRRFGKTVMANMIAAFFENTGEPSLFEHLHIAEYAGYKEQAGKHDVIYIDFSEMPRECQNYQEYIDRVQNGLVRDIQEAYPELVLKIMRLSGIYYLWFLIRQDINLFLLLMNGTQFFIVLL